MIQWRGYPSCLTEKNKWDHRYVQTIRTFAGLTAVITIYYRGVRNLSTPVWNLGCLHVLKSAWNYLFLNQTPPWRGITKWSLGVITEGVPISLLPTGLFHPPLQSQTQNRTPMECLIQITIKGRLVSKLFCFLIVEICVWWGGGAHGLFYLALHEHKSNTRYSLNSYKIRLLIIDLGVMTTRWQSLRKYSLGKEFWQQCLEKNSSLFQYDLIHID